MLMAQTSTDFVSVPVTPPDGIDLDDIPVRLAIVAHDDNPADTEWREASWDGDRAQVLVGPAGALTLTPGDYRVWINLDPPGATNIVALSGYLGIV